MESATHTNSAIELQPTTETNAENEAAPQPPTEQYPAGFRFLVLTVGLILSIFLAALDSSILATAIPRITDQFGTVKDVGWYSTGYWITNAAFQSTWGRAVSCDRDEHLQYRARVANFTIACSINSFLLSGPISFL